ncbi:MAG: hypothetical protein AAF740_01355 [Bacteroidota bacterium]
MENQEVFFEAGDRVWSPIHGFGVVTDTFDSTTYTYSVRVEFGSTTTYSEDYTANGLCDYRCIKPDLFQAPPDFTPPIMPVNKPKGKIEEGDLVSCFTGRIGVVTRLYDEEMLVLDSISHLPRHHVKLVMKASELQERLKQTTT